MNVLVTGGAGFIGSHLIAHLSAEGHDVTCIDNLSVADTKLQKARMQWVEDKAVWHHFNLIDFEALDEVVSKGAFDVIYHIAAKPGVRESITDPFLYAQSNYIATLNVFEAAKRHGVPHVVAASSSSVYGRNEKAPFNEEDRVDGPISVYASTKRSTELLAYTYCDLFDMNITMLRFFTVYGPYGRPDMAPWIFTEKIMQGDEIEVFDHGKHQRDFTYIDDIITGIVGCAAHPSGYNVLNLGNGSPIQLMDFIAITQEVVGKKAHLKMTEGQLGDVNLTYADTTKAKELFGYQTTTGIKEGMEQFVAWYKRYINE